ncbi:MAG: DNA polymerase I [Bacilli bacterium]
MEKIILVDGNNLLFRSYYATAYNGNFMKNSKGFPTNGLFGFTNMINKIILEEKPIYMIVAFDKGKTFRHTEYEAYKAGRQETPNELKQQFPVAKTLLDCMGIKYYEIDNYEADDIIGTFAEYCNEESKYIGTIISSDKDLLQLISSDVDIKLLKSKDYIRYNEETFFKDYGIVPKKIVDLKALMGDSSDNIPGVKGIGEKTALKLLIEHGSLDGIYENIENIKGAVHDKLVNDKENAYLSYHLATIIRDVPMEIDINDIKYLGPKHKELNEIYEDLEFYSFLKKDIFKTDIPKKKEEYKIVKNIDEITLTKDAAIYLEILGSNYHSSKVIGVGIYNEEDSYFVPPHLLEEAIKKLKNIKLYTYDLKKTYVALKKIGIEIDNVIFDTLLAAYLLDYTVKDDIAYIANNFDSDIPFYEATYGTKTKLALPTEEIIAYDLINKAKFIYESKTKFTKELEKEEMTNLMYNIEMPLSIVLGDMEYDGVNVDTNVLKTMGEEIKTRIEIISKDIFKEAGTEFNISSPSQLGEILFDKLELPHGKKTKTGYSTNIDVLTKLQGRHPIINYVMEYRTLTKLYSTYIEGLIDCVGEDKKIHTIYTQALTRTGRLSSIEPNLQNIPARSTYGKLIRKAFIPSDNSIILSGDYSQIELRILAHMANIEPLKDAFKNEIDIHTKTASDIFKVDIDKVTKDMRRMAKAVNFGIVYGISDFGLADNLSISRTEAKTFIEEYNKTYPGINEYMDKIIKEAYITKSVKTLLNRKRKIDELGNTNYMIRQQGERIAKNTPIQGTSADIIKKAMVEIKTKFKQENIKSKLILQVHDELVVDTLKEEKEVVTKILKETMENTIKLSVPLKVEFEYGENWYEA